MLRSYRYSHAGRKPLSTWANFCFRFAPNWELLRTCKCKWVFIRIWNIFWVICSLVTPAMPIQSYKPSTSVYLSGSKFWIVMLKRNHPSPSYRPWPICTTKWKTVNVNLGPCSHESLSGDWGKIMVSIIILFSLVTYIIL